MVLETGDKNSTYKTMNKIYSLKYSHVTGGLIVVSELASRGIKKAVRSNIFKFITVWS
ncbi:ESPR domain-containing protein [Escherichia coli]|nr:hypothetical protein [Escherichia coli]